METGVKKSGGSKNSIIRLFSFILLVLVSFTAFIPGLVLAKEAQLRVVFPLSLDTATLTKGEPQVKMLEVRNTTANDMNIEQVTFQPSKLDAPKEAKKISVTGLQRVILGKEESTQISVYFPGHSQVGEYDGWLYYATRDKPDDAVRFYSLKVEITDPSTPLMSEIPATLLASIVSLAVLILTLWVGSKANISIGFFQSPGGGYSASKFQIWLWTLVIIFSFVYVFMRRGAGIEFPQSIWWLLGISVGSTGTAKFITVQRLKRQAAATIFSSKDAQPDEKKVGRLASLLSEHGQLSLMRLQMFGWTVVTALLFIVHVFRTEALWDVPTGLLVLMGISHAGYLGDKGASPETKLQFEKLEPKSMVATKTQSASLLILGQNFAEGIECYLNEVKLDAENVMPNRINAKIGTKALDKGTYDLSLQNPGDKAQVFADVFEVT
jgi:hypothetical protein